MFERSVPEPVRAVIHELVRSWGTADVYVCGSGDFTLERTLSDLDVRLHGSGTNLYTCVLGWWLSGQPVDVEVSGEGRELLGWLDPYLDGGVGAVAAVMVCSRWLSFVGKPTTFCLRQVRAYEEQWPRLHAQTVRRLGRLRTRLESFFPGPVSQQLEQLPADVPVVSFSPFWLPPSDRQFRGLHRWLRWPAPDDDGLDVVQVLAEQLPQHPRWVVTSQDEVPELDGWQVAQVQSTPIKPPWWVYATSDRVRWVPGRQRIVPLLAPKLAGGEDLTPPLQVTRINPAVFNGLRAQFLDRWIVPGNAELAFAVSCGGRLVGSFAVKRSTIDPMGVYLLSDFPVGWTKYTRLSKLIVMSLMSVEVQAMLERSCFRRLVRWATTAFTDRPMSAKYGRGIEGIRLEERRETLDRPHRWRLSYAGPLGAWTLPQALERWQRKHGRHVKAAAPGGGGG